MRSLVKCITASTAVASASVLLIKSRLQAEEDFVFVNETDTMKDISRIAVIGSGIGGSSATFFLRKLLGPLAEIDVYEKDNKIGGRMSALTLNNQTVESGGTFLLNTNRYMVQFATETELQTNDLLKDAKIGFFNGKDFVSMTGSFGWLDNLKLVWRYGFFSLRNLENAVRNVADSFKNIYTFQDDGRSFKTVPEMLEALNADKFVGYTQKTCREVMKDEGISDQIVDEVVTPLLRWHRGQNADTVNGLVGFFSVSGSNAKAWNIKGGNFQICHQLLSKSNAQVHMNTKINKIEKQTDENGRIVYFLKGADVLGAIPYDCVIIAAPLEVPSCYLECNECTDWPEQSSMGCYQRTVATFVQATVKNRKFGIENVHDLPHLVLTTESDSNPFSALVNLYKTNGGKTDPTIYKVFSREPLSQETLRELFVIDSGDGKTTSPATITAVSWLACPRYSTNQKFIPFQLDTGVFHATAIERFAASMEMGAIGGRNAALLAYKYLAQVPPKP